MREIIPMRLWIGNALDARNVTAVLGVGVSAIVDLAIEEPPIQFPRDVVYCRFPLIDGAGNQPAVLRAAVDTVANFITSATPTLVACGVGMSRSPAGANHLTGKKNTREGNTTCDAYRRFSASLLVTANSLACLGSVGRLNRCQGE